MAYPVMYRPQQGIIPEALPEALLGEGGEEAEALREGLRMVKQLIPPPNPHLKRAEQATAIMGLFFAVVALVAALAVALFSLTVVGAPALAFTVALWTTVGSAALAVIFGIANRIIHSRIPSSGDLLSNMVKLGVSALGERG